MFDVMEQLQMGDHAALCHRLERKLPGGFVLH